MAKQSASSLYPVSFRKDPRRGQARVFKRILDNPSLKTLNVRLPTGYGKTFVALGSYAILRQQKRVDHLLYVVPNDALREQFLSGGYQDMAEAGIDDPQQAVDVRFQGYASIREQYKGIHSFVITPQALLHHNNKMLVSELMRTGKWMIVADEYHHYGEKKAWADALLSLPYEFRLAMSAKPKRPDKDDALGKPDIEVTYREAAAEGAVKPLWGHSYIYRIDLYSPKDGKLKTITTEELKKSALEEFKGTRYRKKSTEWKIHKLTEGWRWTYKYNSPLISTPILRSEELRSKNYPAQVLVGALCVPHAEMLCKQIQDDFGDLRIDWVGTGPHGRPDEVNREILKKFAPGKEFDGSPKWPELDVLVHVGMAGEGLDSVFVTEVVHCNAANHTIQNDQENGRAARMPSKVKGVLWGNINFDSTSEYAKKGYVDENIMDAMDDDKPKKPGEGDDKEPYEFIIDDDSPIYFKECEYDSMGSNDPQFKDFREYAKSHDYKKDGKIVKLQTENGDFVSVREAANNDDFVDDLLEWYKGGKKRQAEKMDAKTALQREQQRYNRYSRALRSSIIKRRTKSDARHDKSLSADVAKQINSQKCKDIDPVEKTVESYKKHCEWLKKEQQLLLETGELPTWAC